TRSASRCTQRATMSCVHYLLISERRNTCLSLNCADVAARPAGFPQRGPRIVIVITARHGWSGWKPAKHRAPHWPRSEEHTSELQSHLNLVCRLLLEKKKKKKIMNTIQTLKTHKLVK